MSKPNKNVLGLRPSKSGHVCVGVEVSISPNTYERLAILAWRRKQNILDLAEDLIAAHLDEQDEMEQAHHERREEGSCLFCGEFDCRGECCGLPTPAPSLVEPSEK